MPLTINLCDLARKDSLHLQGSLPVEELDLQVHDEVIRAEKPLEYDLEVETLDNALLIQGRLELPLQCECVRCLKTFVLPIVLEPYALHLPLEGKEQDPEDEEAVKIDNDSVDLTPYLREDILLEFPQHPLCDPECSGLPKLVSGKAKTTSTASQSKANASAWAALNKLKF